MLLLGVDRFMSEARSITNTIGNAVGTLAIARWVGAVDRQQLADALDGKLDDDAEAQVATAAATDGAPAASSLARAGGAHASLVH
ncbi:C4-dicarboxylate transport protein [compost metagenome]